MNKIANMINNILAILCTIMAWSFYNSRNLASVMLVQNQSIPNNATVLDFGCGSCCMYKKFPNNNFELTIKLNYHLKRLNNLN